MTILVIAALTLREIVRRRVIWVLLILAVVSVALVGFAVERLVSFAREGELKEIQIRIGVSQVLILIAFMFSFVLAMSAAFLAAPAIASDVEIGHGPRDARPPDAPQRPRHRALARAVDRRRAATPRSRACSRSPSSNSSAGTGRPQPLVAVGYLAFESIVVLYAGADARHPAPRDRRGRHHGRPVRPRLVRGRARQHRARVRRRATRQGRRDRPRADPDGRPVAGGRLRPRAPARAAALRRPLARGPRGQSVLRQLAATARVPRLERGLGRARSARRCRAVPSPGALAGRPAVARLPDGRGVEQVAADRRRTGRPAGVVDRREHVARTPSSTPRSR